MIHASRKHTTFAPDLRVRGIGMCSFACASGAVMRNLQSMLELRLPVQSGGNFKQ